MTVEDCSILSTESSGCESSHGAATAEEKKSDSVSSNNMNVSFETAKTAGDGPLDKDASAKKNTEPFANKSGPSPAMLLEIQQQLEYYFSFKNLSRDYFLCGIMVEQRVGITDMNDAHSSRQFTMASMAPITVVSRFKNITSIVSRHEKNVLGKRTVVQLVAEAAGRSEMLVVSADGTSIGPRSDVLGEVKAAEMIQRKEKTSTAVVDGSIGRDGSDGKWQEETGTGQAGGEEGVASEGVPVASAPTAAERRNTIILREVKSDTTDVFVRDLFQWEGCPAISSIRSDVGGCWFVTLDGTNDEVVSAVIKLSSLKLNGESIRARLKTESVTAKSFFQKSQSRAPNQQSQQMQGQPNLWHPHQQSHTLQDGAKPFLKRRGQSGQGGGTNTGNYSQSHPHHQNPNFRQGRMPQPPSVATLQLSASNGYRNNVRQHTSIVQDSTDSRTIRNDGSDASQHHSRNKHSKQGTTGSTGGNYTDGVHVVGEKGRKPAAIAAPPMASPTYFPPLADGSALTPSSPIDKDMVSETVASTQTVTHAETPIASDTKKVMTGYAAALLRPAPPTPPSPPRENDTPTQNKKQSAAKAITQVRYLIFITNCILPFAIATWALNRTKIHSFLSDLVCTLSCADVIFSTQYLLVF
uniref:HTH La-type RNA-binding domain-containing protein n=1 Tax=Corethron hystrix TaxID=216773 RepID=A0A7S1BWS6_9STRA|mmetsp:Transcript_5085/g.10268  ORF Transcript_5085/g.10268 Transcript_5085/m.10268 type:complete len:638 (+) Transcript_5085:349-2262(+)